MRRPIFHALLLCAVSFVWSTNVFSQQQIDADASKGCMFSEVYRKTGWTIPGMPAVRAADKYSRQPYGEMPSVFVTTLKPNPVETTVTVLWCSRDDIGRLQIDDEPIGIISLWAFDFNGQVFAYSVRYVMESIWHDERRQLGGESQVMFYDLDGSGRFTLMKGPGGPRVPTFIPDWVKKRVGPTSK